MRERMDKSKKLKGLEELNNLQKLLKEDVFKPDEKRMRVCCGTACMATGAEGVIKNIETHAKHTGQEVEIIRTGCQGLCQKGPVMKVEPFGYFFQKVQARDSEDIVVNTLSNGYPIRRL